MENQRDSVSSIPVWTVPQLGAECSEGAGPSPLVQLVCGSLSDEDTKQKSKESYLLQRPSARAVQGNPRDLVLGIWRPSYFS